MPVNYDVQQVCENGHQITDCYNTIPEQQKRFCQKCGAASITVCPSCGGGIQGAQLGISQSFTEARAGHKRWVPVMHADVPSYCHSCGKPYPWTENKIVTAIQIFAEFSSLDENEKKTIEQDINNIAKDIPQAELSANRIKRIWGKYGPIAYEIIMEFASRTAAKILKGQ